MPISIHALLAESDFRGWTLNINGPIFLSTLSLRRATPKVIREPTATGFLSTLSLRRATGISACHRGTLRISIHALLAESDAALSGGTLSDVDFYPRSPCGERPSYSQHVTRPSGYFYPRSPCGERLLLMCFWLSGRLFLSTLSLRRATLRVLDGSKSSLISIHALLAESDAVSVAVQSPASQFLSTLSLRRATREPTAFRTPHHIFLSTLSLRRATAKVHKTVGHFCAYETNFMEIASSC